MNRKNLSLVGLVTLVLLLAGSLVGAATRPIFPTPTGTGIPHVSAGVAVATASPVNLASTAEVTNALAVANGGTGISTGVPETPGLRLTLTTTVPVTTGDVTGATSVFWTPLEHGAFTTYDNSIWTPHTTSEVTLALGTLTSGKPYDVFVNWNGSAAVLTTAIWTSDTARASALAAQDGMQVLGSDHSKLYLGTFYTTATTTTEDSAAKRYLFNWFNRRLRIMSVTDTTDSWTYNSTTYRQARATAANKVAYLSGDAGVFVKADVLIGSQQSSTGNYCTVGIGVDSTSANSANVFGGDAPPSTSWVPSTAHYRGAPGLGRHDLNWLEAAGSTTTCTFYGDNGSTFTLGGIIGEVWQ